MAEPDRTNADAERVSDIVARLRAASARLKAAVEHPKIPEPADIDALLFMALYRLDEAADIIEAQSKALAEAREAITNREILAFDWAYTDPKSGRQLYAGTPENARRLLAEGTKLVAVHTVGPAPTPENPNG